jgi:transposase
MRTGRPIASVSLTADERETLESWARRPKSAQALAQRSRIVLESAAGNPNTVVAYKLSIAKQTVGKWRRRFVDRRLDGLLDEPRPGAPRRVNDAQIERVVRLTLESTPADATHWSTRAMAKRCGLSQTTVGRIWRAFALQPHRIEASSSPKTRCSSKRCAILWACI